MSVLNKKPNYIQTGDSNYIRFYGGLAVVSDKDTQRIISVVVRDTKRSNWEAIG